MTKRDLLLTAAFLCFFNNIYSATIQSNVTTGNWNTTSTWVGNILPTDADDVVIATGHTITIDAAISPAFNTCKSLTVNGKLIYNSNASFILGTFNDRRSAFIVNGIFEFSVGYNFTIYGYLKFNTGSIFRMYSGGMIIDGTLGATTSVAANQAHLDVTDIATLDVYRSTITIRNPHYDPLTPCIKGAKRFGNTISFGSGATPDVNNDFLVSETSKPVFSYLDVNIVNTVSVTSRFKVTDIQIDSAVSVRSGTFFNYVAATPVKIKGDFNANQGVTITGNFEFNGTMQQNINPQYLSGATLVTFNGDVIVNNPTEVKSKINMTIQGGDLKFTQGRFDTELKTLTLERTPVGVNSSSYVITYNFYQNIGYVLIKNLTINALFPNGTLFPVGTSAAYTPVWIKAASGDFKVSLTPFVTIPPNTFTVPSSYDYVDLKWEIQRVTGSASANLIFQWNTSNEAGSFATRRASCAVFRHNGTNWLPQSPTSGTISSGTTHTKSVTNMTSFSTFALFNSATLPVEISQFTGKKQGNRAELSWTTASEKDNQGFDIEKNTEGSAFASIGFVKSENQTNAPTDYVFWDNNFDKTAYYRLKTTDSDGKETYSKVITIEKDVKNNDISVFPNPILRGSLLNIQIADTSISEGFKVEVFNTNGQLVTQQRGIAPLQTEGWMNGIYFVKIVNNVNVVTIKVVKE
jgi:Secretion system C-terminal sorting domain